jgi:hypothetical protein
LTAVVWDALWQLDRFHQYREVADSREEQLFLERLSIAMLDSVLSGAAFLNEKAA